MPTSDVTLGRIRSSPDYEFGWIKSGQLRTVGIGSPSQHLWVEKLSFYGGEYSSSTPTTSMAAYELDSGKNPTGPRVGYSGTVNPTNDMNSTSGGQVYNISIIVNDLKPANTSTLQNATLQFWSNKRYGVGVLSTSGETSHGQSSVASGYNNRYYQRNGLAQPPPTDADPFASSNPEAIADFWVVGQYNVSPLAPSAVTPSGSITSVTPEFTGNFRDLNGTYGTANGGKNMGDNMKSFQIIVYDASNNVMWNSGVQIADQSERIADAFSITYAGSPLVRGSTYTQIVRVQDQFDAWSPYCAAVSFTITNAGLLTLDGNPTGTITTTAPATFDGKYTHPTSLSATHVQILLMNSNGAISAESPQIAKPILSSAAPGTAFSITWAESTFSALTWGSSYYYAMRVRDSAGNWSNYPAFSTTDSSQNRSFRVNSAPNIPSQLSPASGVIKTTRPLLSFVANDDDNTSSTGLIEYVRIKSKQNIQNPTMASVATSWAEQYKDTGWTYTASRDASIFQDAAGSMKIAVTNAPATTAKLLRYTSSDYLSCVAGETYDWSTYLRKDNALLFVRPVIVFENSGGSEVGVARLSDPGYTINTWNLATVTGVAPATAIRMKVGIELYNSATGAVTWNGWIDNISPVNWQVRSYKTATYGLGKWTYQTTFATDDTAEYQEYRWDAFGYDGSVYSGRALTAALAQKSSEFSFTYAAGPSVVIDTPLDNAVLATSRLNVAWTAATQTKYRVILSDLTKNVTAYDTGLITSSVVKSLTIPAGTVRNNRTYRLSVAVKDASNLDGEDIANLTSVFDATEPLANFSVTGYSFEGDAEPSGIIMSWDATDVPLTMWQYYRVERVDPTGERTEMKKIYSPSQTTYIDSTPASGVQYSFELSQMRLDGIDMVPSDEQVSVFGIDLPGVVISSVEAPDARRVMLHFADSRSQERKKQSQKRVPLAGQTHPKTGEVLAPKPITISSRARWFVFQGEYNLVSDLSQGTGITAKDRYDQLMELDESDDIVCVRDERGTRKFCKIDDLKVILRRPDIYTVSMTFTEETFFEIYST